MKRILMSVLVLLFFLNISAQNYKFKGIRIYINPGHGAVGYNSIPETGFNESESNLQKGLFLKEILLKDSAIVFMSRTQNCATCDLPLDQIAALANAANADFFHAIHSNASGGNTNAPLMLFRGYDNTPTFPKAKELAQIMWKHLDKNSSNWTQHTQWVKGDWSFYPDWGTSGLGVLRPLTMPGVLSEGSFHDYIPESWRLMNNDYRHNESWAFARTYSEYKGLVPYTNGVIIGVIRDKFKSPPFKYISTTNDKYLPINGAKVTLKQRNKTYMVDNKNNGVYYFDSIAPGTYKLIFEATGYYKDSTDVVVKANESTLTDRFLQCDTTIVPQVLTYSPNSPDSIMLNQSFTVKFSYHMKPEAVNAAIKIVPEVSLLYSWQDDNKTLIIKPVTQFGSAVNYTITISKTAISQWKVPITADYSIKFVTKKRNYLTLENQYPKNNETEITPYLQVRLFFDAPINQNTITGNVKLLAADGQQVAVKNERIFTEMGKGFYYFEPASALKNNVKYKITISTDLKDEFGASLSAAKEISFTTREKPFATGTVFIDYEDPSSFWDPNGSGSTTGTNDELTVFSKETDIKMSGTASGKISYLFTATEGGNVREYNSKKPNATSDPKASIGLWVFGDLSNNQLEFWFYYSGSSNAIAVIQKIDWAGWKMVSVPYKSIPGVSGMIQFHSVVIKQVAGGAMKGEIYCDDAMIISDLTGIENYEPEGFKFSQNYPNPFSYSTKFEYYLPEKLNIKLTIFNSYGQVIHTLISGLQTFGSYQAFWIPENISNGLYFYKFEATSVDGNVLKALKTGTCLYLK